MNKRVKKMLDEVLDEITPSENDRSMLSGALKRILDAADEVIGDKPLEKTIAGSFIRDTWLPDKKEIDLFILFPVSYSRRRLEKRGLETGRKIMKKVGGDYEIAYAEHPYVRGRTGHFSVDIVPCYKVPSASDIKSAVDRTPFHNRYITRNLKPAMAGDVRLLKQFAKAADIYGSDVRTMGLSGYLCELLIIRYRTFLCLVKSAKYWKFGKFIDLEGHCAPNIRNEKFGDDPLVVIDPTDPKRNVSAALSVPNFKKFVDRCSSFCKKPSKDFFRIRRIPLRKAELRRFLKQRGTKLYVIRFRRPPVVDDILWSQKRKTKGRLEKLLEKHDFRVSGSSVWSDDKWSYLIFEMEEWRLPPLRKVEGPPASSGSHSMEFVEKYGNEKVFVKGERLVAETGREYRKAEGLLRDFLHGSKGALMKKGVRSNIAGAIAEGFAILEGRSVESLVGKDKAFSVFLKKYFECD